MRDSVRIQIQTPDTWWDFSSERHWLSAGLSVGHGTASWDIDGPKEIPPLGSRVQLTDPEGVFWIGWVGEPRPEFPYRVQAQV